MERREPVLHGADYHVLHGARHDDNRHYSREDEFETQPAGFPFSGLALAVHGFLPAQTEKFVPLILHSVLESVDSGDRGIEADCSGLIGKVHIGLRHALHTRQRVLHAAHAGGATHAAHVNRNLFLAGLFRLFHTAHLVPQLLHLGFDLFRRNHGVIKRHVGAFQSEIYVGVGHALKLLKSIFHPPHTGGATHAADGEGYFAVMVLSLFHSSIPAFPVPGNFMRILS